MTPNRKSGLLYLLLLIPFIVYLKGLAPSVVFGDTGDYLTAGWLWGVAHPPGYPLFTILTGIFERLPIPPIWVQSESFSIYAWRGNLLSMLFGLATLAVLFALVRRLTGNIIAGIVASGALAFSYVFWWHSEICENDTMSAFLLVSMLLLSLRYVQDRKIRDIYLLGLVIGSGIAHHHVLILFILPVFLHLLISGAFRFIFRFKYKPREVVLFILVMVIGLLPLLYLPAVNYRVPERELLFESELTPSQAQEVIGNSDDFYSITDKSRVEYFLDYVLRGVYARQRVFTHIEDVRRGDLTTTGDVNLFYTSLVYHDFGPVLSVIGLLGLAWGIFGMVRRFSRRKPENNLVDLRNWSLIFIGWLIYFLLVNYYPSGDILNAPLYNLETAGPGLMLPLEVLWAVFAGIGTGLLLKWTGNLARRSNTITVSVAVVLFVLIIINGIGNYPHADKSHHTIAHEYAVNVMNSCPDNSILVTAGDEMYVFRYIRYVHPDPATGNPGYRPDILVMPWSGMIRDLSELSDISVGMTNALVRLIQDFPAKEIGSTFISSKFLENETIQSRVMARRGLVFSFIPDKDTSGLAHVNSEVKNKTGVARYELNRPDSYDWDFWDSPSNQAIISTPGLWPPDEECRWRTTEMLLFYGTQELVTGNREKAVEYFERLIEIEPWNAEAREYLAYATDSE